MLSESKPLLTMNTTVNDTIDGEAVALTCSMKFRTSKDNQENVRIVIDHPGAAVIDSDTKTEETEVRSVVTVQPTAYKNTSEPTSFGPIQCGIVFKQPENDTELAQNPIQFHSAEMSAGLIQCKCFIKFIIDYRVPLTQYTV